MQLSMSSLRQCCLANAKRNFDSATNIMAAGDKSAQIKAAVSLLGNRKFTYRLLSGRRSRPHKLYTYADAVQVTKAAAAITHRGRPYYITVERNGSRIVWCASLTAPIDRQLPAGFYPAFGTRSCAERRPVSHVFA